MMRLDNQQLLSIICTSILIIRVEATIKTYKLERPIGSTVILPPCLSTILSSNDDATIIIFKSDSGELISMNGILISDNPRFAIKNIHLSEVIIEQTEPSDEGHYECRVNEMINYIVHLIVFNSSTLHLNVLEGSNITLQCMDKGVWVIEEGHHGGPVRTQYSKELMLDNIRRNDNRFQKIVCSSLDGHEKHKPTVKLLMSIRRILMCIICAHPIPHRIEWWWNGRKERDDNFHQTKINQSCIAQQFIFLLEKEYDTEQTIVCEAENVHGISRDSFQIKAKPTTYTRMFVPTLSSSAVSSKLLTMTKPANNNSLASHCNQFVQCQWMFKTIIIFCFVHRFMS